MLNRALGICLLALWVYPAAASADEPSGLWVTGDGQAVIDLIPDPPGIRAVLVAVIPPPSDAPQAPNDVNNPDPSLRGRPLAGLELGRLAKSESNTWAGRLYDPDSGKTFRVNATRMQPGILELRGYVAIPAFGRTMYWVSLETHKQRQRKLWAAEKAHE